MSDLFEATPRAHGDVPAERICLKCKASFPSDGFGDRLCKRCKSGGGWKNSALARGPLARG